MYTIIVTDDRHGQYAYEEEVLREIDATLTVYNFQSAEEAFPVLREADGVLLNLFPLTGPLIQEMNRCKVISRYGVGYDNVDLEAATAAGIQVTRVPDYCVEEVTDQTLSLLFGIARKTVYKDREVRKGRWNLIEDQPCFRMKGRTFGIIGYGRIGRRLHRKVTGFGFKDILAYDPYVEKEEMEASGACKVDFTQLVRESDYISVHAAFTNETEGLIDKNAFKKMKDGVLIVNTARGGIINENDLAEALREGKVAGAGLDVFENEPLLLSSELRAFDTVIFSDHTSYYSEESIRELKTKAARNIVEVLTGKQPSYPVNSLL
jgi:D-3-phosphoglycerate dehydrogenase / 2-oxoglutarate reductase